jgi:hypothetical protein
MAIAEDAVDHQKITPQGETAQPGVFSGGTDLWHPVDELAQVQAELERLHQRKEALVDMFLTPGADSRFEGQTHVVEVVAENRRTFDRRRLPAAILQDDRFYAVSTCRNVRLVPKVPEPEDAAVIEPFH